MDHEALNYIFLSVVKKKKEKRYTSEEIIHSKQTEGSTQNPKSRNRITHASERGSKHTVKSR